MDFNDMTDQSSPWRFKVIVTLCAIYFGSTVIHAYIGTNVIAQGFQVLDAWHPGLLGKSELLCAIGFVIYMIGLPKNHILEPDGI